MAILTPQSAHELRRIIKEATGRDISQGEAYAIWNHLIKLLQLLWRVDNRREIPPPPQQLSLFRKSWKHQKP